MSTPESQPNMFQQLFRDAEAANMLEYLFTLVRVDGMSGLRDPLLQLQDLLNSPAPDDAEGLKQRYCSIVSAREPLELLANLINCVEKKSYTPSPFHDLWRGTFPNFEAPRPSQVVDAICGRLDAAGRHDIIAALRRAYPEQLLAECSDNSELPPDELQLGHHACLEFLRSLLEIHRLERLKFRTWPRFHKLPRFEVLELLANDDTGLYGFRMHFSNGTDAVFSRTENWTECMNVMPQLDGIGFQVGDLDALRQEWRVGDTRLYEVGLPGRYNNLGEWKPLIYPGNAHPLQEEARAFSDDPDVQGGFFYMLCTGHRVIEFVIRSTIDLPLEHVSFGKILHLSKCPVPADGPSSNSRIRIYDGSLDVDRVEPEHLRDLIAGIGVAVNRLGFAYGGIVEWRVKYSMTVTAEGLATPSKQDLELLDSLLRRFPTSPDSIVLDAALDWYNRGRSSRNPFTAFLCYYVAIESVASAVGESDADLGLGYRRGTRQERAQQRLDCIAGMHEELYAADPVGFVREAYSECVVGLRRQTQRIAELVFGADHEYVNGLFRKVDGYSLYDIRNLVAHGSLSLVDPDDERLVRSRLGELARIASAFLTRVVFRMAPGEQLPQWSGLHKVGFSFADPRSILIATPSVTFPTTDWKIRPEWCD